MTVICTRYDPAKSELADALYRLFESRLGREDWDRLARYCAGMAALTPSQMKPGDLGIERRNQMTQADLIHGWTNPAPHAAAPMVCDFKTITIGQMPPNPAGGSP